MVTNLLFWSPGGGTSAFWWHDEELKTVRLETSQSEESHKIPCRKLSFNDSKSKSDKIAWRQLRGGCWWGDENITMRGRGEVLITQVERPKAS
jgi:hypothetical protein